MNELFAFFIKFNLYFTAAFISEHPLFFLWFNIFYYVIGSVLTSYGLFALSVHMAGYYYEEFLKSSL